MKIKHKYPKPIFMSVNGYHPDRVHFDDPIGLVEPVVGDDGIPVQKPNMMLVDIVYPFLRKEVWVEHKELVSWDNMCRKYGECLRAFDRVVKENERVWEQVNKLSTELRLKEDIEEKVE